MKTIYFMTLTVIFSFGMWLHLSAQNSVPSKEKQIKAAVAPLPENLREGATVLGYEPGEELITIREGTNEMICVSDNPGQDNFHVSCYHKDLEPFMKRGRELKLMGKSRTESDSLRFEEIKSGELTLPSKPMALYSLSGSEGAFNYETGDVNKATPLYVIYIPYATEATTGLSQQPASPGAPWIMEPGTPWAHIMVMTGREVGNSTKTNREK